MEEIWVDIKSYEGIYQVSNFGNVKSMPKLGKYVKKNNINGVIMKQYTDKRGYCTVTLYKDGVKKTHSVHRLVAEAFLYKKDEFNIVMHKIESIPSNNHVDNLKWGTSSLNRKDMFEKGRDNLPRGERHPNFGKVGVNKGKTGELSALYGKTGKKSHLYGGKSRTARLVLDTSTGIFYECLKEATEAKGLKYGTVLSKIWKNKNNTTLIYV
jgi:hypothetical protein